MKVLILVLSLTAASVASADLNQCLEYCRTETEPGWERKQCLAQCVKEHSEEAVELFLAPQFCETYEPDCERDDNEPLL